MRKTISQRLPEIVFFCVSFTVISLIIKFHYRLFSETLELFLLNFGLHVSYWTGSDILITIPVCLIARYTFDISQNTKKSKLITASVPVLFALVQLGILCWIQVFRREDFWEVQYARDLGLFKFIGLVLQTEGGRFFSYFLKGLNSLFTTASGSMIYMNTCLFISLLTLLLGIYRLLLVLIKTSVPEDPSVKRKQPFSLPFVSSPPSFLLHPNFGKTGSGTQAG